MNANEVEYDGLFYRINPEEKTAVLSKSNSGNPLFCQEQMILDTMMAYSEVYEILNLLEEGEGKI